MIVTPPPPPDPIPPLGIRSFIKLNMMVTPLALSSQASHPGRDALVNPRDAFSHDPRKITEANSWVRN